MPEKSIDIPPLSFLDKTFDKMMVPVMWALGGFKNDSIQETHAWHIHPVSPEILNEDILLEVFGDEDTQVEQKHYFDFLFHAPIFGGWKKYIVVGHDLLDDIDWHIGWHVMHKDTKKTKFLELNRLKLKQNRIKLLKGSTKYITKFFAFTHDGRQIKLNLFDEGIHGDKKHKKLRLL